MVIFNSQKISNPLFPHTLTTNLCQVLESFLLIDLLPQCLFSEFHVVCILVYIEILYLGTSSFAFGVLQYCVWQYFWFPFSALSKWNWLIIVKLLVIKWEVFLHSLFATFKLKSASCMNIHNDKKKEKKTEFFSQNSAQE